MMLLTRSENTVVHCQNRCPVLLTASTVVFNPKIAMTSAKMIFENATSVTSLCSLTITVACFDVYGKPCGNLDRFTYPHLAVGLNASFGYHIYAALSLNIYRIEVAVLSAQFADGTVWMQNNPGDVMHPAVSQPDLSFLEKLADQYRREMALDSNRGRIPVETPNYWLCCCTAYNNVEFSQCRKCGRDREVQIKALDVDYLGIQNEAFIKQQAEREQQEAKARDRADETVNNVMSRIFHLLLVSIVCVAIVLIAVITTAPTRHYKVADVLYESGNYTAAFDAFSAVGTNYKDGAERLKECRYSQGVFLYDHNEYDEAVTNFSDVGTDYRDVDMYLNKCYDSLGHMRYNDGDFVAAYAQFSQITPPTDQTKQSMDTCVVKGYDSAIAVYNADGVAPEQLSLPMFDGYRDTKKYRIILSTLKLNENSAPNAIFAAYYALKDLGEFGHADKLLQDKKYTWWLLNNHRFVNSDGYYFEMADKKVSFNLPEQSVYYFDNQVTYNIKGTTYYHILADQSPCVGFRFNFIDEKIMALYCFKDGSVQTLFRQY